MHRIVKWLSLTCGLPELRRCSIFLPSLLSNRANNHKNLWYDETTLPIFLIIIDYVLSCDSSSHCKPLLFNPEVDTDSFFPAPVLQIPGLLSRPYLTDDWVHPHDLISDQAEEPKLVCLGGDLHSTLLTGRKQLLPALHHFMLAACDGFGLLAGIHRPQLGCTLL